MECQISVTSHLFFHLIGKIFQDFASYPETWIWWNWILVQLQPIWASYFTHLHQRCNFMKNGWLQISFIVFILLYSSIRTMPNCCKDWVGPSTPSWANTHVSLVLSWNYYKPGDLIQWKFLRSLGPFDHLSPLLPRVTVAADIPPFYYTCSLQFRPSLVSWHPGHMVPSWLLSIFSAAWCSPDL